MVSRLLLSLLVISSSIAAQRSGQAPQPEFRYEKRGNAWFRSEGGLEYRIDPRVVTVRLADSDRDPIELLGSLLAPLDELRLVRSNVLGIHDLEIPARADPLATVRALRETGLFTYAEENTIGRFHFIPDDADFGEQWNFHNTGQGGGTPDADVDGPEAWDIEDGDPSVVIAVIDSGADQAHGDLTGNLWTNPGETLNGLDDDQNGYVDDITGWDFVQDDNDPTGNTGHGTAVASMPGAVGNNALDLAGLAGGAMDGAGCSIMNLRMSSAAVFLSSAVDDAILYAADNGAHVITLSLGIGNTMAMNDAIAYAHDVKGLFINCSTGNTGRIVEYPANHPLVVAVGSSSRDDSVSSFSGRGPDIDVIAPGDAVPALRLGGGIVIQTGTSFSSPTVAGLAGLILSHDPSLSNEAVRQLIELTADDVDAPGFENNAGWGRINAHSALLATTGFVPYGVQSYGVGLQGTGGVVPSIQIAKGTRPGVGSGSFAIGLSNARAQVTAFLGASATQGATPFRGGTILIGLAQPLVTSMVTTGDGGAAARTLPLPNDPGLIGVPFFSQWLVLDPAAVQGWSMTPGLQVTIGS